MPSGTVHSFHAERETGFIKPDAPRRDGKSVRITRQTVKSGGIRKGDHVEFECGTYRNGPTAATVRRIEPEAAPKRERIETLFGADEFEPWSAL
jgi:cold shock CspA family protein